jgi:hypothetical protein
MNLRNRTIAKQSTRWHMAFALQSAQSAGFLAGQNMGVCLLRRTRLDKLSVQRRQIGSRCIEPCCNAFLLRCTC